MTPNHDYSRIIVPKDSPLLGTAPDEIRTLLQKDYSEKLLTAAMAAVSNHTGYIHHNINDPTATSKLVKILVVPQGFFGLKCRQKQKPICLNFHC